MKQITASQLNQRLSNGDAQPLLLDVREPNEFAYCRIKDSVNLPMGQVFARLSELNPQQETVVICHHGMRSAQVANFLVTNGFADVTNLTGGVAAWAAEVEPTMPTY
jgi:rhodanese-related sulfurtransferase